MPDADSSLPAGDPFMVYPGENGIPLNSIREETYFDSLQDYSLLKMLEDKKGKIFVKSLLKKHNFISYNNYPFDDNTCLLLHDEIIHEFEKYL